MKSNPDDKRTLRVASVQLESLPGGKNVNFSNIETFVERAAQRNVRLIIFPECCITGYRFVRNLPAEALAELAEPVSRKRMGSHLYIQQLAPGSMTTKSASATGSFSIPSR